MKLEFEKAVSEMTQQVAQEMQNQTRDEPQTREAGAALDEEQKLQDEVKEMFEEMTFEMQWQIKYR